MFLVMRIFIRLVAITFEVLAEKPEQLLSVERETPMFTRLLVGSGGSTRKNDDVHVYARLVKVMLTSSSSGSICLPHTLVAAIMQEAAITSYSRLGPSLIDETMERIFFIWK